MRHVIALVLWVVVTSVGALAQSVSYNHQILMPDGCHVTLSVARIDTTYYIIAKVYSDNLKFLNHPMMLLKNYNNEVLKLPGELLLNDVKSSGMMVGDIMTPIHEIYATAQFEITPEQFELIKDGVSKIRLTTTPIVHEKSFKKDKFGQKLYGFFQTLMTTPIDDF